MTGFFDTRDGQEPVEFNPPDTRPLQDVALVDTERRTAVQRGWPVVRRFLAQVRSPLVLIPSVVPRGIWLLTTSVRSGTARA